ncbi:S-adenosyl-L-methionine-dependent methyltransferase [Zopfia rhizophila CBS 207.26]|uniref:S-adenosyl-L-methionine-dependent methyltransferase n=1 Tax=Zopfia rhizophila CBS 207.26 TaxID=1314779 RepID=A0A6A6DVH3_9PEZI|nr:S-adenosyl-L-methionine-dependent methyltransferase [Zopfia rhizophila CBS 207.26]
MAKSENRGEEYEAEHVHSVYEQIAFHFSSTRYKPWPIVERFLQELPDGSVCVDVGCGNGKYLAVNPRVFIVGSDRSTNLVKIATRHEPHACVVADNLSLPHPPRSFDFAISIAVIHHLSTPSRRIEAVRAVLELLKPPSSAANLSGGKALIYVWALEQKDSRRGWDEGHEQDVMVPWVMKSNEKAKKEKAQKKGKEEDQSLEQEETASSDHPDSKTFLRYYHLYRKGELEHDVGEAGGEVLESGYEKDNWWVIATVKGS